ncbi:MAG: N-acetylmuramic acid 6-phosphate etherase [Chloroflexi bacterium]|nr:MAG: N-acetylmuramic acid 6-phosphate etherase [Chloroflexota bacterium]
MDDLERLALGCLLPGFDGTVAPEWVRRRVAEGLGGVVLYGRNVRTPEQVASLTAQLRADRADLVVAIDEEGGDVTRLEASTGSSYPGNLALGQVDDVALTRAVAEAIAGDLRAAGIGLDLAPVADVNSNPNNPVIGVRSFGAEPELVARHVRAFVDGLQSRGVAACAKHFPGHGDTAVDSHESLPTVTDAASAVAALVPFRAAIAARVQAIMTAHILVPADDLPATLSRRILTGLLRQDLGFTGCIITDGMDMGAISRTVGTEEGTVLALAAGADAICTGGWFADESVVDRLQRAIVRAVHDGRLSEARLREAARRTRELVPRGAPAPPPTDRGVGLSAARRAVHAEGNVRIGLAPVVVELSPAPLQAAGAVPWGLGDLLAQRDPAVTVLRVSDPSVDVHEIVRQSLRRPLVIVVRDLHRHPWAALATEAILDRRSDAVIVEMGTPVSRPAAAAAYVTTYGAGRVNGMAAVELLTGASTEQPHGETDALGRLATRELLALMHAEDVRAVQVVGQSLDRIAEAVERIADRVRAGGRLHYFGAGTSGRLAALDAHECPATFGLGDDVVIAHVAGEGAAEDDSELGRADAVQAGLRPVDAVVGVSASGQTPYVLAAMDQARRDGALSVALVSVPGSELARAADVAIEVATGPEVVAGSTRLKAGTAQKTVLNMLSTGVFARLGHVYRGRMVDVVPQNEKLRRRARAMIADLTGAAPAAVERALEEAEGSAKLAILMLQAGLSAEAARMALTRMGGDLAMALEDLER